MVVLETLPGATLSALIADEPVPGPEEIGHLGLQLASAVALPAPQRDPPPRPQALEPDRRGRAREADRSQPRPSARARRPRGSAPGTTWPPSRRAAATSARRPTSGDWGRCCSRSPPARRPSTTIPTPGRIRSAPRQRRRAGAGALPAARAAGTTAGGRAPDASPSSPTRSPPASSPNRPTAPRSRSCCGLRGPGRRATGSAGGARWTARP